MKLLSALIISFGLSVSVWADDAAIEAMTDAYNILMTGTDGITSYPCSRYMKLRLDNPEVTQVLVAPSIASFISGYNLANFFQHEASELQSSVSISKHPMVHYRRATANDPFYLVNYVDDQCKSHPTIIEV